MILFDTSVIIDARDASSRWHGWAKTQIADAVAGEGGAGNTVVVSEATVRAVVPEAVPGLLESLGLSLLPLAVTAAVPAAKAFRIYLDRLKQEGKSTGRTVPLPDFLIGAHAEVAGLKLATRDPDRVRTYFPQVTLLIP